MQQNKLHIFIAVFFNSPMGGLHLNVLDTVEALLEHGHDVTVLSKEGVFSEKIKSIGADSIVTDFENIQQSVEKVFNSIEKPIDVIHSHPYKSREVAQVIAQKIQKPFIVTLHSINDASLYKYIDDVDALIVVSELIKDYVLQQNIAPADKIFVIPNGVDIELLHQLASKEENQKKFKYLLENSDFGKKILIVSRYDKDKEYIIASLLDTWQKLLDTESFNEKWLVVGTGSELPRLEKIAKEMNKSANKEVVQFLGWQNLESLSYLYSIADIFVGPGRTILEAMSFSKPCIALGSKGYIGIVDSQNVLQGIYTNFGGDASKEALDTTKLYKDLKTLVRMEEEAFKQLEELSFVTVQTFYNLKTINEKMLNLYALFDSKKPVAKLEAEGRRFLQEDFIDIKQEKFEKEFQVKEGRVYTFTCSLYNYVEIDTKRSFISFEFNKEKLDAEEVALNQFLYNKGYGYYYLLPQKQGFQFVIYKLIIPKNVSLVKIKAQARHSKGKVKFYQNFVMEEEIFYTQSLEKLALLQTKQEGLYKELEASLSEQSVLVQQLQKTSEEKENLQREFSSIKEEKNNLLEQTKQIQQQVEDLKEEEKKLLKTLMLLEQEKQEKHKLAQEYKQKIAIEKQTRLSYQNSLSYQLGYTLLHFYKSFKNFRSLPKDLYKIYKLSKDKKKKQNSKKTVFSPKKADQMEKKAKTQKGHNVANLLQQAYFLDPTYERGIRIISQLFSLGFLKDIYAISQDFEKRGYKVTQKDQKIYIEAVGLARLYEKLPQIPNKSLLKIVPKSKKVAMFLHASLPHFSNGYATRSHGILTSLKDFSKYNTEAVTRVGYPWDVRVKGEKTSLDIVDGVAYHHLAGPNIKEMPLDKYLAESANVAEEFLRKFQPEIVHSASAYTTALSALIAARRVGVPFVYEVRGLWEVTKSSTIPSWGKTERFLLDKNLETLVAKNADHVITLTQGLKEELIKRGVDSHKISVIPNSIDIERFSTQTKKEQLAKELGLNTKLTTIGYIGSIVSYEGLDDLLRALKILKDKNIKFNFLLVGDGKAFEDIKTLVKELSLTKEVIMPGRIAHDLVEDYYSLIDIAPFPRKPLEVCEIVSPLKPFEAMALEKAVIASNVQALTEIVQDNETGILFEKGDIQDLAQKLQQLIEDQNLRRKLGKNARRWVEQERTWKKAVESFDQVYDQIRDINKEKRKLRFLVYGDLNLNYIDGSAIWVVSLIEVLSGLENVEIDFLLKAELSHDTLLQPLFGLKNVTIKKPTQYTNKKVLKPFEAVEVMKQLDKADPYDFIILRGFDLCTEASRVKDFRLRLWPYLTDIPQSKDDLTSEISQKLYQIISNSDTVLCQTKYGKMFLDENIEGAKDKTLLLQPMIPDVQENNWKFKKEGVVKIVYAGKFAPLWGTREMFETFKALRQKDPNIELHIFGDKIHNPKDDPTFYEQTQKNLTTTEGVVWYGKVTRKEVLEALKGMDIAWAWRLAELEMTTHELSTKVLEYGSFGIPTLMMGNEINKNLLGDDYPLFCDKEELVTTLEKAIHSQKILSKASQKMFQASQSFSFSAMRKNHLGTLIEKKLHQKYPKTVLIAGHDLKFFTELEAKLKSDGYRVLIDKWHGHNKHNIHKSKELLVQADIIICEWCLGNAVWYSHNKAANQKLLIRFHRQEIETKYPEQLQLDNVDAIIFVGKYYLEEAKKAFKWKNEYKFHIIGNYTNSNLVTKKDTDFIFHLGIVGIVPKMKRLDRALDILEKLRKKDKRFKLFVKGKTHNDFPWMKNRPHELEYYEQLEKRIEQSKLLKDGVIYDGFGKDMPQWYQKIGFVLSTSEFESFHLTVADGASAGSIPIILEWKGSTDIYPKEWSLENEDEAAKKIYRLSQDTKLYEKISQDVQKYVERFSVDNIYQEWKKLL